MVGIQTSQSHQQQNKDQMISLDLLQRKEQAQPHQPQVGLILEVEVLNSSHNPKEGPRNLSRHLQILLEV